MKSSSETFSGGGGESEVPEMLVVTGSQREAVTQLDFEATCWRCRATWKCDSLVFIHRNCMTHTFSVLVNNILSESLPKRRLFNLDLNFLWLCPTMHHIIRYRITEEGLCDCVIFPQNGTKCLSLVWV